MPLGNFIWAHNLDFNKAVSYLLYKNPSGINHTYLKFLTFTRDGDKQIIKTIVFSRDLLQNTGMAIEVLRISMHMPDISGSNRPFSYREMTWFGPFLEGSFYEIPIRPRHTKRLTYIQIISQPTIEIPIISLLLFCLSFISYLLKKNNWSGSYPRQVPRSIMTYKWAIDEQTFIL